MRKVFFDAWAWIALMNSDDNYHKEAKRFYVEFRRRGGIAVTTDYVLAETFSALRKALPIEAAAEFGRALFKDVEDGKVQLEFVDEALFFKAWELYEKYQDKRGISFFDLSSVAMMEEMELKEIFTWDKDFERVALGYMLLPGS